MGDQGNDIGNPVETSEGNSWSSDPTMRTAAAMAAKVDCYSFALVLWVLLQWKLPFRNLSPMQILITVSYYHRRPSIKGLVPKYPEEVVDLMRRMWNRDPSKRPTMAEAKAVLQQT